MKYTSNAKYGEPVETGTIYRGDNKRLYIYVFTHYAVAGKHYT